MTLSMKNPGWHYDAQAAVGITFTVLALSPIVGLCGACGYAYYVLVVLPDRRAKAEAQAWAEKRSKGDSTLVTAV